MAENIRVLRAWDDPALQGQVISIERQGMKKYRSFIGNCSTLLIGNMDMEGIGSDVQIINRTPPPRSWTLQKGGFWWDADAGKWGNHGFKFINMGLAPVWIKIWPIIHWIPESRDNTNIGLTNREIGEGTHTLDIHDVAEFKAQCSLFLLCINVQKYWVDIQKIGSDHRPYTLDAGNIRHFSSQGKFEMRGFRVWNNEKAAEFKYRLIQYRVMV